MNRVTFLGRLCADPQIRYSQGQNQTCIASFDLAVNRRFKRENEPDADFFQCTAFGKQGEFAEKYLKKGIKILCSGQIQNNNYTNKDGQKVYGTRIVLDEIEFAESKNASNSESTSHTETAPKPDADGFMSIPGGLDDELPFA